MEKKSFRDSNIGITVAIGKIMHSNYILRMLTHRFIHSKGDENSDFSEALIFSLNSRCEDFFGAFAASLCR